jgi:hypoxanthine phosphoribosyltransferase
LSLEPKVIYSKARLATRIAALGKQISKDYKGRTVDAVIILEDGFIFAADLLRAISQPVVCHFVRLEMRDVELSGFSRREVFFTRPPVLKDRDILIIASMLHTGVTIDFLCKRLQENRPRSLRIAVLLDKPEDRRVDLQPDYFGFLGASNRYVGYGLAGSHEHFRNLPFVGAIGSKRPAGDGGRKSIRASRTVRLKRGKS